MKSSSFSISIIGGDSEEKPLAFSSSETRSVHKDLLAQYVRVAYINKRQGTASTKDRSQVAGTTHKIYRQKGTGNARHGSMKAPIFKGGGVVGGPKPKIYEAKLNKKQALLVFRSICKDLAEKGNISVLSETIASTKANTKNMHTLIVKQYKKQSVLFIFDHSSEKDKIYTQSVRNLPQARLISVNELSALDLMKAGQVLLTPSAWKTLQKRIS